MDLEVQLVSPAVWTQVCSGSFSGLRPRESRLAKGLLMHGHNRHVGITPDLCRSFATIMLDPEQRVRSSPVGASVLGRLTQQLKGAEKGQATPDDGTIRNRQQELMLRSKPVYFLLQVILPLVESGISSLGQSMLFSAKDEEGSPPKDEYLKYQDALNQKIIELCEIEEGPANLFWADRALTISSSAKTKTGASLALRQLPDTDMLSVAYLLRLSPRVKAPVEGAKQIHLPDCDQQIQQVLRQREGGVNGIKITNSLDDIDSMLHSELAYPDTMLLDKLANSGYMVYERNPKKQEQKDVLIVGVMPPNIGGDNTRAWLKGCWFETMARLSSILIRANLSKSDFSWIHSDPSGNPKFCEFPVRQFAEGEYVKDDFTRAYRGRFLTGLNWLPDFLDEGAGQYIRREDPMENGVNLASHESGIQQDEDSKWAGDAWRGYIDERVKSDIEAQGAEEWTSQYRHIHIMTFQPTSGKSDEETPASFIKQYLHLFNLSTQQKRYVSVVWVPDTMQTVGDLSCWFSDKLMQLETRLANTTHDEQMTSSWLVNGWLKNLIREIWNG